MDGPGIARDQTRKAGSGIGVGLFIHLEAELAEAVDFIIEGPAADAQRERGAGAVEGVFPERLDDGLALAVIADQLGLLFVLTVGATMVAASCSGRDAQPSGIAHRILVFPPFLAVLAGLVAGRIGPWPLVFQDVLSAVAATLTPLALFSVGLRFRPGLAPRHLGPVGAVLAWKMLLAPAAVLGLGWAAGITGLTLTVGVLQAAMGPMITAAIIADQHGLESEVINTSLGSGVLLTFLTVPAWNMIL